MNPLQDATKVNFDCFIRVRSLSVTLYLSFISSSQYSTAFIPDEDGDWEFGVHLASRGNLFFDNKLIVDLSTNLELGENFFGLGTIDKRAVVKGLKAGHPYDVELRISTSEFALMSPFPCWGGLRLGGIRQFDGEEAIKDAAALAKDSDGVPKKPRVNFGLMSFSASCHPCGWIESRVSEAFDAGPLAHFLCQLGE